MQFQTSISIVDKLCQVRLYTSHVLFSLDHPDLSLLDTNDERLDELLTKKFDAKARLTKISVNDLIGHWQ